MTAVGDGVRLRPELWDANRMIRECPHPRLRGPPPQEPTRIDILFRERRWTKRGHPPGNQGNRDNGYAALFGKRRIRLGRPGSCSVGAGPLTPRRGRKRFYLRGRYVTISCNELGPDQLLSYPPIMGGHDQHRDAFARVPVDALRPDRPRFRRRNDRPRHAGDPFRRAFASAVLATFFTAAVVSAPPGRHRLVLLAHRGRAEVRGPHHGRKSLPVLEGPLYEVIRNIAGSCGTIMLSFPRMTMCGSARVLFCCPFRKRERADNIIVLEDRLARFDPASGIFTRGEITIGHLKRCTPTVRTFYVLRKE